MYNNKSFSVPKKAETRSEFGAGCPKKKKKNQKQEDKNRAAAAFPAS